MTRSIRALSELGLFAKLLTDPQGAIAEARAIVADPKGEHVEHETPDCVLIDGKEEKS